MPSCLGICIEKNLIKYAKLTKDKSSSLTTLNSFGIKFYDSLADTVREIISETQSENTPICVGLNTEDYTSVNVFSKLSSKDVKSLVTTNFNSICEEKNVNSAVLDMRYILVRNTGDQDTYKAICIAAHQTELTNLGQVFGQYKLTGITSVGLANAHLLKNKGVGEKSAIVNIEDDTKITVFNNGEIAELITIPLGMDEIFARVSEKYNSYSRAYDACKGVDVYANTSYSMDEDTKEINEILLPILYDLKQRIIAALYQYKDTLRNLYITGTGVIINNIDLYFEDAFTGAKCEVLIPYFINRDRTSIKDVLEVNNALAIAAYGVDGVNKETDFFASGGYLKNEANKNKLKKQISMKDIMNVANEWMTNVDNKMKRKVKSKDRRNSIAFDDEVEQLDQLGGAGEMPKAEADSSSDEYYDPFEEWLTRIAISAFVAFAAYAGVSHYTGQLLDEKISVANTRIADSQKEIKLVENDITYIGAQKEDYDAKTEKLQRILETIKTKEERSFDIPNLLSRLMFSIPEEVKVTSVRIYDESDTVKISAESGRYAQLGYFVSRLKLEGILEDVNMEVVSMDTSSIKININGVLP
ncbi:MAG: hypothetical protein IKK43_06230 [Clostridia bacterium]|nr:hypothetical protein [Clostridia bacterium]